MNKIKIVCLMVVLALTGCVTGTRNIDLDIPEYKNEEKVAGSIFISEIHDKRAFEQKPREPSTPSVKGDLSSKSQDDLSTLIGRQRNSYGAAMGDVALSNNQTVQQKVRELLTTGLESRGYKIVEDENTPNQVTIDIEKFWAWFSPGLLSVSFESDLQFQIEFKSPSKNVTIDVTGYGINKGQVASDENWKLAYQRAYLNFLENLDEALDSKGL